MLYSKFGGDLGPSLAWIYANHDLTWDHQECDAGEGGVRGVGNGPSLVGETSRPLAIMAGE
jgi:hypothetical protein